MYSSLDHIRCIPYILVMGSLTKVRILEPRVPLNVLYAAMLLRYKVACVSRGVRGIVLIYTGHPIKGNILFYWP